ncbi:MAG TPA: PEP-CTERM sorting domain-containing protein [Gemmataceae bacterium]|nr:PEP-CTERM sorting domain-containing protein [Gemmataceae bacterium]
MTPPRLLIPTAALILLLLGGASASADPIAWSYSWSSNPGVVTSDDGSLGKVTFAPASGGPLFGSQTGGDGVLAATLNASTPASGTATFTNQGYGLTLHLTDNASHESGDLTFSGALSGSLGSTGALTNSFQGDVAKSLSLGGNQYLVTVGLFVPPAPDSPGRLGANVTVTGSGGSTTVISDVPEPTSLILASLGLSALGVRCYRRKTKLRQENARR